MKMVQLIALIIGIISVIIAIVNYHLTIRSVTWWPSGWFFTITLLSIVLIISNVKLRSWYLSKKFGPGANHELLISGNKVYLVTDRKVKRWLKNEKTVYELGYDFDQLKRVTRGELNKYKEERPLSVLFWE